jgi:hypothetical protein
MHLSKVSENPKIEGFSADFGLSRVISGEYHELFRVFGQVIESSRL